MKTFSVENRITQSHLQFIPGVGHEVNKHAPEVIATIINHRKRKCDEKIFAITYGGGQLE